MIDLNKNQIFDPPIELEVSRDNKKWFSHRIDKICHNWDFPFFSNEEPDSFKYARHPQPKHIDTTTDYKYAKPLPEPVTVEVEIEDTFDKMFKAAFDKA